jgi:hypothetical protein
MIILHGLVIRNYYYRFNTLADRTLIVVALIVSKQFYYKRNISAWIDWNKMSFDVANGSINHTSSLRQTKLYSYK